MDRFWRIAITLLLPCALVQAQTAPRQPTSPASPPAGVASAAPATAPSFEVASVRMAKDHNTGLVADDLSSFPANLFTAHNMPLNILIAIAYGVDGKYIQGAPGWVNTQRYDVNAKVEGDQQLTYEQMEPLLQKLLGKRFRLVVHRETKMTSGFALVIAKDGPKLQSSKEKGKPSAQILPNSVQAWRVDVKGLCGALSIPVGWPVVDKTGLTGTYDIKLHYAPANDPTSAEPSIFTAVQEQLGLKLAPEKVPVDYLIVDYVNRVPTEN